MVYKYLSHTNLPLLQSLFYKFDYPTIKNRRKEMFSKKDKNVLNIFSLSLYFSRKKKERNKWKSVISEWLI